MSSSSPPPTADITDSCDWRSLHPEGGHLGWEPASQIRPNTFLSVLLTHGKSKHPARPSCGRDSAPLPSFLAALLSLYNVFFPLEHK